MSSGEPLEAAEPASDTSANERNLKDGKKAWVVCFTSCMLQVLIVGNLHCFGVFFTVFLKEFNTMKGKTAWIGSFAYGLSMLLGPVTSSLVIRFGNRIVVFAGSIISFLALLCSSYANSIDMLFLTYSVLFGIGVSLSYTPTMCIADDYFNKYLTQAVGIMTAGSSIGTLVLSPVAQALIDSVGWRNAFRIMASFCLMGCVTAWCMKPLVPTPKAPAAKMKTPIIKRLIADLHLWRNKVFVIWVSAQFVAMFGFYIPYIHLISYAEDLGIPPEKGSIIMMTLGASTATGRVMFGKIVDLGLLNRVNMHQLSMVATGAGSLLLPTIRSFGGLIAYVIIMGLVDGCFVVLLPTLNAVLAGAENKVLAWGYLAGVTSITFTLGPPVAGWIYDATGNYNLSFTTAGIPIIFGALILFLIPWAQKTGKATNLMTAAQSKDQFSHSILEGSASEELTDIGAVTSQDVVTVTSVTMYQGNSVLYEKTERSKRGPLSPTSPPRNLAALATSAMSQLTMTCSSCKRQENIIVSPRSVTQRISRTTQWSDMPEHRVYHVQSGQNAAETGQGGPARHGQSEANAATRTITEVTSQNEHILLPVTNGHIVVPTNMPIIASDEYVAVAGNAPPTRVMSTRGDDVRSDASSSRPQTIPTTTGANTPNIAEMLESGARIIGEFENISGSAFPTASQIEGSRLSGVANQVSPSNDGQEDSNWTMVPNRQNSPEMFRMSDLDVRIDPDEDVNNNETNNGN